MYLWHLFLILTFTKLGGFLVRRAGQPAVLGELLAGIVLGPSLLHLIAPEPMINDLAQIGVILLMFLAGLETDVKQFVSAGVSSFVTALAGVIVPLLGGTLIGLGFGLSFGESAFLGTVLTATSVSISAQTLMELGKLRSKEGVVILGAAVIDDVLGIIVLTLVMALVGGEGHIALIIGKMALFFVAATWLGARVVSKLSHSRWVPKNLDTLTCLALAVVFLYSFLAKQAEVADITGAYLAGILLSRTPYHKKITEQTRAIAYSLLTPIFFASIGINAELSSLHGAWLLIGVITLFALVSKVVGCGLGALLTGFDVKGAVRVGIGMISRGEVALIVAMMGLHRGLVPQSLYAATVVMVLVTTIVTPMLLKWSFQENEKEATAVKPSLSSNAN